jgi:hypothetical protein
MVKWYSRPALMLIMVTSMNLAGCAMVRGIFKAGVWVGVIGVALIVALLFGISRLFARP